MTVRFTGRGTLAAFECVGAIRGMGKRGVYVLVRRWGQAGGDADLDERKYRIVANLLNDVFSHLMAYAYTLLKG